MESCRRESSVKKGPWSTEEDEILLNYVSKHGPKDWSNIRSKGLLPRTGKSCRLRYINKLQPNLKSGCKFSPEEEKTVIEMQSELGNKWAQIALLLPGRTDNDVKNFWSTRRKRLQRLLPHVPDHQQKKNKNKKKKKCDGCYISSSSCSSSFGSSSFARACSEMVCGGEQPAVEVGKKEEWFGEEILENGNVFPVFSMGGGCCCEEKVDGCSCCFCGGDDCILGGDLFDSFPADMFDFDRLLDPLPSPQQPI